MSEQIKRRWGILFFSVLMLIVTMGVGTKGSLYAFIWAFIGYYAYKGNLKLIEEWLKWVIFLNLGILLLVIFTFDDGTIYYLNRGTRELLTLEVLIALLPKVGLYFYVRSQQKNSKTKSDNELGAIKVQKVVLEKEVGVKNISESNSLSNTTLKEEELWERALNELGTQNRKNGLWAKCFAEADGDENKAKAAYIRLRVAELMDEVEKQKPQFLKTLDNTEQISKIKPIEEAVEIVGGSAIKIQGSEKPVINFSNVKLVSNPSPQFDGTSQEFNSMSVSALLKNKYFNLYKNKNKEEYLIFFNKYVGIVRNGIVRVFDNYENAREGRGSNYYLGNKQIPFGYIVDINLETFEVISFNQAIAPISCPKCGSLNSRLYKKCTKCQQTLF